MGEDSEKKLIELFGSISLRITSKKHRISSGKSEVKYECIESIFY
jgi:hypothetical protein